MSPSSISNKIKNSAHSELNKLEYYSIHKIKKKINNLEDIFNRNIFFKKVKVDNSYPKYILDNKKKFKNWTVK